MSIRVWIKEYIALHLQLNSQLGIQQALLKFYEKESESSDRFLEAAKCVALIKEIERQIEQNLNTLNILESSNKTK